jgi:ribosomal 30S subunit maturation factor RimM
MSHSFNDINEQSLFCLGLLKRTHNRDLPDFVFVRRDGLFVPFRSSAIASLMGEEIWVKRADVAEQEDDLLTWQDLVGYTVMDEGENGEWSEVGVIATIDESTINTLATLEDGRMMPLHEDFIVDIDEEAQILRVHLPFTL